MKIMLYINLVLMTLIFINTKALASENDQSAITEVIDRVELKTSFIKGNKELPQVLYIVPWQEIKKVTKKPKNMVLHSLYGNIFQPVTSDQLTVK